MRRPVIVAKYSFAVAMLIGIAGGVINSEPMSLIALLLILLSLVALTFTVVLTPFRWLSARVENTRRVVPSGPTDAVRTSLRITPKDGSIGSVGRLGGSGTHIVEHPRGTYVLVIVDNGLGVGFTGPYGYARAWAQSFVDELPQERLAQEMLYDDITKIEIVNFDVIISGSKQMRLAGWYHMTEPSHRAQVHRLIEQLGFEEQQRSPGTYLAAKKQGASPKAA